MASEPPAMVFQNKALIISNHALEQFQARWKRYKPKNPLIDPLATLKELIDLSTREELDPIARVRRTINNGFQLALYYRFQEWRFVIVENKPGKPLTLVTTERNLYRYKRPKSKFKKRSRS
jgi:hypothetical protein